MLSAYFTTPADGAVNLRWHQPIPDGTYVWYQIMDLCNELDAPMKKDLNENYIKTCSLPCVDSFNWFLYFKMVGWSIFSGIRFFWGKLLITNSSSKEMCEVFSPAWHDTLGILKERGSHFWLQCYHRWRLRTENLSDQIVFFCHIYNVVRFLIFFCVFQTPLLIYLLLRSL